MNPCYRVHVYDAGGNRTVKIDAFNDRRVEYHYDLEDPSLYGSNNNRLMWYETIDTTLPAFPKTMSRTYYVYTYDPTDPRSGKTDGNVTRIITESLGESGQQAAATPPPSSGDEWGESGRTGAASGSKTVLRPASSHRGQRGGHGGGEMSMPLRGGGGNGCLAGQTKYTSVRLGYASNGRTVTFVHDETWCAAAGATCAPSPGNHYAITWAREFRYDGARARYLDRKLDGPSFKFGSQVEIDATWTDYDGDEIYGDFEMVSGSPVNKRSFEPGIARTENPLTTPVTNYYHGDMLGTTRLMTTSPPPPSTPTAIEPAVYTAFGERITGPANTDSTRYGYVGAWGYEQNADFPFLHVGARYYDPSSGRFLQRDPIGIEGGTNVYAYVVSSPTMWIDPMGQATQSFWPPNTGRFRYGPSRGPGRPPGSYAFRFPGPKGGPHLWGASGAAAFGLSCAIAAGTGAVAGRVIDNSFGNSNNGIRISDGLADILFRWVNGDPNYNPWG